MYVIDTNLYIRALTDRAFAPTFHAFQLTALPMLRVSAVVLFELLAGAQDDGRARALERALLAPFRRRGRLLVPADSTWRLVAAIERALRAHGRYDGSLARRSFLNDMLLAASCREVGATLITENARDFRIIRQVFAFRFVTAFPAV